MADRHVHTLDERRQLFALGFGDGALDTALEEGADAPDYCNGWEAGNQARRAAVADYCDRYGLPRATPLRDHGPTDA